MGNHDSKAVSNTYRSPRQNQTRTERSDKVLSTTQKDLGTSVDGPKAKSVARQQGKVSRLSVKGVCQFESRNDEGRETSDTNVLDERQRNLYTFKEANFTHREGAKEEASKINENGHSVKNDSKIDDITLNEGYYSKSIINNCDRHQSNNFTTADKTVVEKSDAVLQRPKSTDNELFKMKTSRFSEKHGTVRPTAKHLSNRDEHNIHEASNYTTSGMAIHSRDLDIFHNDSSKYVEPRTEEPTDMENKLVPMPAYGLKIELSSNSGLSRKLTKASNDNRLTLQMDEDEISKKKPCGIYTNVMFLPDKSKGASPKRYGPKRLGLQPVVIVSSQDSESQSENSRANSHNSEDCQDLEDVKSLHVNNAPEQSAKMEYVVPKLNLQTLSSTHSCAPAEYFENNLEFVEDHFGLFTGAVACGVINSFEKQTDGTVCEGGPNGETSCFKGSDHKSGFSSNEIDTYNPQFIQSLKSCGGFNGSHNDRQFDEPKRFQMSSDTLEVLNNDSATATTYEDISTKPTKEDSESCISKDNEHFSIDEQNSMRSKLNAVSYPTFGKNCRVDIDWNILQSRQGRFASTLKSSNTNIAEDNRLCLEFSLPFKCGVLEEEIERPELLNNIGPALHSTIKGISTSCGPYRESIDNDLDEMSDDSDVCTKTAATVTDLDNVQKNSNKDELEKSGLGTSELQKINTMKCSQFKKKFEVEEKYTADETSGQYPGEQSEVGLSNETCGSVVVNKLQTIDGYEVMEAENFDIASIEKAAVVKTDIMGNTESQTVAGEAVTEKSDIVLVMRKGQSKNEIMRRDLSSNKKEMDISEKNNSVNCPRPLFGSKSFPAEDFQNAYKRKKTKPEHDNRFVFIDDDDDDNLSSESCFQPRLISKLVSDSQESNTLSTQHERSDMLELFHRTRHFLSDMDLDFSLPSDEFQRQFQKHYKRIIKRFNRSRSRHELSRLHGKMKISTNKNLIDEMETSGKQKEETISDETLELTYHEKRRLHRFLMDSDDDSDVSIPSDEEDNDEGLARLPDGVWNDLYDQETEKCCRTTENPKKLRCTVVCVDISESMMGEPWLQMRKALQEFVLGLEEVKTKYGTTELVSLVTFGHATEVALTPTTDYSKVMNTFDKLEAKGNSPLAAVLMLTLFPVVDLASRRYRFEFFGQNVRHRVILMSDFCPTPHEMLSTTDVVTDGQARYAAEEVKRKMKFLSSQRLKYIMNIHCVPIGHQPNMEMVEVIVKKSGGEIVPSTDIHRLCTNTHNYINSLQIAMHMHNSDSKTLDTKVLRTIITTLYPDSHTDDVSQMLSEIEVEFKMHKKQRNRKKRAEKRGDVTGGEESSEDETGSDSDTQSDDDTDEQSKDCDTFAEVEGMPAIGSRVKRGPDFDPKKIVVVSEQGTITGHCVKREACLYVHWDCGIKTVCRYGKRGHYDVVLDDKMVPCRLEDKIKVGHRVRQGPDWQYGNQNGGSDQLGTIFHVFDPGCDVRVRWDNGNRGVYRYNCEGAYDVLISTPDDPFDIQRYTHEMNRRNLAKTRGIDINAAVHYRHEKLDIDLSESLFGLDLVDHSKGQENKPVNKNAFCRPTVDTTTAENLDITLD